MLEHMANCSLFSFPSFASSFSGHVHEHAIDMSSWFRATTCLDAVFMVIAFLAYHFLHYRSVRGPKVWPVVGMMPQLCSNIKNVYDWVTLELRKSGGTFTFIIPAMPSISVVFTSNPSNLEYILKSNVHNFPKGVGFTRAFHDLLGNGIFNSDGQLWRSQRQTASFDMHSKWFRELSFNSVQSLVCSKLVPLLRSAAAAQTKIDLQDVMLRFTFDNICLLGLGVDVGCLSSDMPDVPFAKAFDVATENTFMRFLMPEFLWRMNRLLGRKKERALRNALKIVDKFAEDIINERKMTTSKSNNLLSCLMQSGTQYSDKFLRDFAVNFILAGRDTSSVALTWFVWLLAQNPTVEEAVYNEILDSTQGCNSGDEFSIDQLKQMNYLHAALCESMRLYPPVPIDNKDVLEDDTLPDGTRLKKGSRLFYSIYSMARMESIWGSDCLEFKPERWLRNGAFVPESPFKFPVFNAGPRLCLGKELAFVQMKYVAAAVVKNFVIRLVPGHAVKKKLSLTLFMKNGLLVTVYPREPT